MKKIISFALIAAALLSLTACRKENEPSAPTNGGNVFYYDPELMQRQLEQFTADFPEEFPLPDGSVGSKSDFNALSMDGIPTLDYAFIRYAEPIFYNTIDEPEAFDPDTSKIKSDPEQTVGEPKWIKVKAGDILENGLAVVSAQTYGEMMTNEDGSQTLQLHTSAIRTEGEITLEGIFEYYNGSSDYGGNDYFYSFYPDCSKHRIPAAYGGSGAEHYLLNDQQIIYSDGGRFYSFQFKDDDIKSKFNKTTVCKAKVSFKSVDILLFDMDGKITSIELE